MKTNVSMLSKQYILQGVTVIALLCGLSYALAVWGGLLQILTPQNTKIVFQHSTQPVLASDFSQH